MSTQAITLVENKKQIVTIISTDKFKAQLAAALMARLPEDYVVRAAVATINSNEEIQKCSPVSIAASILLLAQAGLAPEPWKGHGWLIPRNQKIKGRDGKPDTWIKVCTALLGYRGLVKLAYDSAAVAKAGAYPVFQGDVFHLDLGSGEPPMHEPWIRPVEGREKRGELLGCYALAKLKNGETLVEWMTKDDIDAIRTRSAASDRGPWVTDYVEMARKTPFRRLFKWIPDAELQKIAAMDEASDLGHMESTMDADTGEIITMVREDEDPPAKVAVLQPQRVNSEKKQTEAPVESKNETPDYAKTTVYPPPEKGSEIVAQDGEHEVRRWTDNNEIACAHKECKRCNELAAPFIEKPKTADSPSTAPAAEAPAQQQAAVTSAAQGQTAEGGLFDKAEPATKELTYDMSQTQVAPDPYHKEHNPQGKHISDSQHGRLWAILHSAQKKAEAEGKKAMSDDEFMAHVKAKGYADARYIPKTPKSVYDDICTVAGGEALKVNNGK